MSYLFGPNFIQVTKGTTVEITVVSTWDDGTLLDLTNATVLFTIKNFEDDIVPIFHRKGISGAGFTISSPKSGKIVWSLSATETSKLPVGVHYYDVWVVLPAGTYQLEKGQFEVTQGIALK